MNLRSYKVRALVALTLLCALTAAAAMFGTSHSQGRQIEHSARERIELARVLIVRALVERSAGMATGLRPLADDKTITDAMRRRDGDLLRGLVRSWTSDLTMGRMGFLLPSEQGGSTSIDADGPREDRRHAGEISPSPSSRLWLEPWGEPVLISTMPAKVSGDLVGAVSISAGVSGLFLDVGKDLALRLFLFVPKTSLSRQEWERRHGAAPDDAKAWDRLAHFAPWGDFPDDVGLDDSQVSEVLERSETTNPVTFFRSGRVYRGAAFGIDFPGSGPGPKVLAVMDVSDREGSRRRSLWWIGLAAFAFTGVSSLQMLVSFLPLERRLFRAHRLLLNSNSLLEEEVARRTQQITTVNSRLQYEVDVRNQAEQKLLRHQMFLLTVLDSLAYPFIVVDTRDFGIKLANKTAMQHSLGPGDVATCFGLIYGRDNPCRGGGMPCVLKEIYRTREPVVLEHRQVGADSGMQVYEVHAYPVTNGRGEIEQIIEYFIDITERKRAEEALNASEHNYRQLVETANSIVLRWDTRGVIRFINGFGARFFGFGSAELNGRSLVGTIVPEVETGGRNLALMLDNIIQRPDRYQNNENENVRKDGRRVWVSWANKAILDAEGRVKEILSFGNDVTQKRQAVEALRESEERFRNIYENSPMMMHSLDEFGRIIDVNRKWLEETRYARGEAIGSRIESLLTPESAKRAAAEIFPELRRTGYLKDASLEIVRKDGAIIDILMDCSVSTDAKGGSMSLAVLQNVSERRRTEKEMQLAASVFENSIEGIVVTDPEGRILRTNKAFTLMTGYSAREALGRNPSFLQSGRHDVQFFQGMWNALLNAGIWQGEIWNRRKNGEIYPEWLGISTVYDERHKPIYYVGVSTDITDQKLSEERIYRLAHYDALTDLPNRVLFQDRLERALLAARRDDYPLPLLYLDLDRFKPINDSFGHPVGDSLLQQVAARLRHCVRESDTVARMGGDEFTVILGPGYSAVSPDVVQIGSRVARAILDALSKPFDLEGNEVFISASIGIVVYPQDGDNVAELVKNADTAMYHAKAKGRNNFLFYEAHMNATAADRLMIENSLRRALDRGEFELYFQPSVNIVEGRIAALEALIRWRHPELGMIPPDQFVYLAEESGLIVPIGEWVLRESVRQLSLWRAAGYTHLRVAVNLSLRQFRHRDLMNVIRQVVGEAGQDASVLALEVTESAFMEDEEDTIARLNEMSQMGIQILIDDFGTGYSSLARLRALPIQVLKIDRSFVRDITTDPNDASIIAAIIAMAHNLQLTVIAEGVETTSQLRFLKARQCEEVQGYLFSRPVPAAEVLNLLAKGVELPDWDGGA